MIPLINGISLGMPQVIRLVVDRGIARNDARQLAVLVGLLLGLAALKGALTFIQGRVSELAAQGVAYELRREIHDRLTHLSFSFHDKAETGQLLGRAIQDVERIRVIAGRASMRLIDGAVLLVATFAVMVAMNPLLAACAFLLMPCLVYRAFRYGYAVRPMSLRIQNQLAVLASRLEQNLRGVRIVKGFVQESHETERFERDNAKWFEQSVEMVKLQAKNDPLLLYIVHMAIVATIGVGGWLIIGERLSYGELVAFTVYLTQLIQPVRLMGRVAPKLGMAISSGERIFEILDTKPEVADSPGAVKLPAVAGEVVFDNVSFAYAGRGPAVRNVSFKVRAGEIVALLGGTGSGKSTVLNLIPRFYDPAAGRITIDGFDTTEVTVKSLRDQIGIVLQDTALFSGTIRENISFGKPSATDDEVTAAAEAAQAHEFIVSMPDGYDTRVAEMGRTLSGGQRQRVVIARALLKDPPILLLDDATSSVDAETEYQIQQALRRLMTGRTTFIIAQRLSTLELAGRAIVMENGSITADGRHDDLLRDSSLYREIYERQMLGSGQSPVTTKDALQ